MDSHPLFYILNTEIQILTFFMCRRISKIVATLICCLGIHLGMAQVKIGENLQVLDGASILELESTSRALVLTRVNQAQMSAITPLHGALVYNTDAECIFVFDGTAWKSLCGARMAVTTSSMAPIVNQVGDVWIDSTQNNVNIWNGSDFVLINRNPKSGNGLPSPITVNDPLAGDIYVDKNSGDLFTYDGTNWIVQGNAVQASNGITETSTNTIELGGALTRPTSLQSNSVNTFAIEGLQMSNNPTDLVVVMDASTQVLRQMDRSFLLQREETLVVANNGQNQFATPLAITDTKKIDVYRNGIKINFTAIGSNTIALDPGIICFQDDEIRIVQFF